MAGPKLEAKLGLDNSEFKKGLKESETSIGGFKTNLLGMASGIAIATGALKILGDYFKSTDQGARLMNTGLRIAKQAIADLASTTKLNLANLILAGKYAKEENNIREGNRVDLVKEAELQRDLNKLRLEAADQTKTDTQRITLLNDALKKHNELIDYKIADTKEELLNIQKKLSLDINNTKWLDEEAKIKAELINLDAERYSEARRMESTVTGLIATETERIKDLAKAQREALARLKEANALGVVGGFTPKSFYDAMRVPIKGGGLARGGSDLAGGPEAVSPVNKMTEALQLQSEAVNILTNSFDVLFTSSSNGFQEMIATMIEGMKRLVAEYIAKAVIFGLIRALFPGSDIAIGATQQLWNMGLGGKATQNLGGFQSQPMNVNVVGSIKGKDIALALRRNG